LILPKPFSALLAGKFHYTFLSEHCRAGEIPAGEGSMRILAEVVLVGIILGGAIVFYRAIWKLMDKDDKHNKKNEGGDQ
jgi:hypothetical protein